MRRRGRQSSTCSKTSDHVRGTQGGGPGSTRPREKWKERKNNLGQGFGRRRPPGAPPSPEAHPGTQARACAQLGAAPTGAGGVSADASGLAGSGFGRRRRGAGRREKSGWARAPLGNARPPAAAPHAPRACEMWTPFLRAVQTRRALRPGRRLPEPAPRSRRRAPVLLPSRCGPSPCLPLAAAGCAPSSPCAVRTPLPPASGPPLRLGLAPVILFPVPGSQRCFPPFRLPPPRALSLPVPRFLVTDRLPSLSPRSACEHFLALPALCEPCLPGFTPAPQSWPLMPRNCFRVVS